MQNKFQFILLILLFTLLASKDAYGEELWKKSDRIIETFSHKLAETYHLKLLVTGYRHIVDSKLVKWDISLLSHQRLTLEETRKLAASLTADFLQKIYTDPLIKARIKESMDYMRWSPPILQPSRIGIKLTFWQENFDRVPEAYIAQVIYRDEKFEYFISNPKDQSLIAFHTETLQEAFKLLSRTLPMPPDEKTP